MYESDDSFFEKLKGDLAIIQFRTILDSLRSNKGLLPEDSIRNIDRLVRKEMAAYIFKTYPELNIPDEKYYSGDDRCHFPDQEIFLN